MKNQNQIALLTVNILLVFFLILFSNLGYIPLRMGDFMFMVFLLFLTALYRPSWMFLFFTGTIMLENINLAPAGLGIAVRPYQLLGGIALLAFLVRLATKRLNFAAAKFAKADLVVILVGAGSYLSIINSQIKGVSFKQAVIVSSYIALYFLARNFLQTKEDLKKVLPFFLSSSCVVVAYALWQNVRFLHGFSHFEVMPGRPNATFMEPDWFGIHLSLLLALLYSMIFYLHKIKDGFSQEAQASHLEIKISKIGLYVFILLVYIVLILTVARSAWLGAFFATVIFLFAVFTRLKADYKLWQWRDAIAMKAVIVPVFILGIASVYLFGLTNFQLFNRFQSAGTGQQKITVSCVQHVDLGSGEWETGSLADVGCKQINLEDIEDARAGGGFISEAYRKDPSTNIRSEIYKKSWELVMAHPVLGIGWGSASAILGKDDRGAGLNASNIFLDIWLGSGIIGLAAFVILLLLILKNGLILFLKHDAYSGIFILTGSVALIVPNIFNSGIFLGILWLFLGAAFIKK